MGKTENGAIWLDKKLLSPYDYWQFWRNVDDKDTLKFLKYFTNLSNNEIQKIEKNEINNQKIILANETTKLLHGEEEAKIAAETAHKTFKNRSTGEGLPVIKISEKELNNIDIIALIILSKLEKSKSEIRRIIKNKGVKINDKVIVDEKLKINKNFFIEKRFFRLSLGKKRHVKILLK